MTLESADILQIPIEGIIRHQTERWTRGSWSTPPSVGDQKAQEDRKPQSKGLMTRNLGGRRLGSPRSEENATMMAHNVGLHRNGDSVGDSARKRNLPDSQSLNRITRTPRPHFTHRTRRSPTLRASHYQLRKWRSANPRNCCQS